MVKVGDRVRLSARKGPDREGVVTAVIGSMVRVRWPSQDESTVIPAPGTMTVLASSGDQARPKRAVAKKAAGKKATPNKTAAKKATPKKTAPKKTAPKK